MGSPSLDASPTLALLLDLAGRRASGRLELGNHTLLIADGLLVDVLLPQGTENAARSSGGTNGDAHRERMIERVARALRAAEERAEPLPVLEAASVARDRGFPLVPILLDAMVSAATDEHAALLATHMNHRLALREGALADHVRAWAHLDSVPPRPALSTVLAKRPEAGPAVTALLRTGAARLEAPGRASPSLPSRASTLPPPPPRLSTLPSEPPPAPIDRLSRLSVRAPRLRLDPGQAHDGGELLTPTALPLLRGETITLEDPIEPIEQRIAALEKAGAPGPERARAFGALADVWLQRFGSIERACRALREAVAADPTDGRALTQTALYCHVLGQAELSQRYCEAAIAASAISIERANAQRLRAKVLRAAGDLEGAVEALCEAAADDPGSPEPHEHLLSLLERDNPEGANAHARLSATAFQDREPERALSLLDQAAQLVPRDVATAQELASMLDASGLRLAAVHALERAAERQADADTKRKLRLSAAQRAEAAGRADIAAELLEAAFDSEPEFDLVHAPLDEDMSAAGFIEARAVLLEDIATACPDAQRSHWLTRAAEVRGVIEGERDAAVWLAFEAVLIDPVRPDALILLRSLAKEPVELILLAYALRAAAVAHTLARHDARPLLRELSLLAIERIDNAQLGLATLEELARRGPLEPEMAALRSIAERRARERETELVRAEAALAAATPAQRPERCLRVASLLPDLPETWPRRIALLEAALAGGVRAPSVPTTLEALYGLSRDATALSAFLETRARKSAAPAERVRALARLLSVHAVRDDHEQIARTAELLLEIDPAHRMALARLERVAKRAKQNARLERAIRGRLEITKADKPRARLLARLARIHAAEARPRDAVTCAAGALELDPHAADAAMLVLEHASHLPVQASIPLLEALSAVIGPSARLHAALVEAARARNDYACIERTLARWVSLLPSDAAAHRLLLALLPASAPARALGEAAERALDACPVERVADSVLEAIDKLALPSDGHAVSAERARAAAGLCLRLAEEQGRAEHELIRRAAELGKHHAPELATRALELLAGTSDGAARVSALLEVAQHHASLGDAAGELRALLRVLELDITHRDALLRVRFLYRASGDMLRAQSVTALLLELETEPKGRRERLLELSALAAREQDLERIEQHVRHMIAQSEGEPEAVRSALGVLLEVGPIEWALARARAIADDCPPAVRGPIYHSIAATAEQILLDPRLALELAALGTRNTPAHAPLLLMVERLALTGGDPQTAVETYENLLAQAIGPHGRRALCYRAGRWLERAGRPAEALERYLAAFELEPSAGAAFTALERVARETGQVARTLPCYERLAETVRHEGARIELLRRAALLALDELQAPEQGFELARRALALRDNAELLALAERSARMLQTQDAARGREAFDQLVLDLTQRAEQLWDGPDKVRSLVNIGRILHEQLGRADTARSSLNDALALATREQLGDSLVAEVQAALDRLPAKISEPAPELAQPAPGSAPPAPSAPSTPGTETPADLASGADAALAPEHAAQPEAGAAPPDPAPAAPPAPGMPLAAIRVVTMSQAAASAARRQSATSISLEAIQFHDPTGDAMARELLAAHGDREAALANVRATIAEAPFRTDALRAWRVLASTDPSSAEAQLSNALVSSFEQGLPEPPERELHSGVWRGQAFRTLIADELPEEAHRALARLWHCAGMISRFRSQLGAFGLSDRDKLSRLTVSSLAEAYAQAARLLGATDVPVYASATADELARVLPTHPPCVLVSRSTTAPRATLSYVVARALMLAEPARFIGGSLVSSDARELLDAARLAFAPATLESDVTGRTKELAAALWQNVPAGEQRDLSHALKEHADLLRYDTLHASSRACAARAALACSGSVRAALRHLPLVEESLHGLDLGHEAELAEGCRRSPALAATIRAAVSSELLEALSRAK